MNVATHPVAQLSFRVIPDAQPLQHPHRPRSPRTHTFHTIYDHRGLISEALSGGEARGETVAPENRSTDLPYRQTFAFNAFGQMTASTNMHWGETEWNSVSFDQTTAFENNRVQTAGWTFDNDGRNTYAIADSGVSTYTAFDAAGRVSQRSSSTGSVIRNFYDGNGKTITSTSTAEPQKYLIRSSLMKGQVISEAWPNGKKYRSYVKGLGNQTAVQTGYATATSSLNESVLFEYSDALGMSYRTTDKDSAAVATGDGGEGSPIETDPLGGSVGLSTPYIELVIPYEPAPEYPELIPFTGDAPQMSGQDFASLYATFGSRIADLPGFGTNWGSFFQLDMALHEERVHNSWMGIGFVTNEQVGLPPGVRVTSVTPRYHDFEDDDGDGDDFTIGTGTEIIGWNVTWDEDKFRDFNFVPYGMDVYVYFKSRDSAQNALKDVLKGDCGTMLNSLLRTIKEERNLGFSNDVRATSVDELFTKLVAQAEGGIFLNVGVNDFRNDLSQYYVEGNVSTAVGGGGGLTQAVPIRESRSGSRIPSGDGASMFVYPFPTHFSRLHPTQRGRRIGPATESRYRIEQTQHLMVRLIHEMFHAAGQNATYSHTAMDTAAGVVDPDISGTPGSGSMFNRFVKKHCTNGYQPAR